MKTSLLSIMGFFVWLAFSGPVLSGTVLANGYQGYITSLDPVLRERVQTALKEKGFDPEETDGRFGQKSERALLAFRRANKIDESDMNRILTPKLAKALLGINLPAGINGKELLPEEQIILLRNLGLIPTKNYWKREGIVLPD
ncbi:peptidoglycan-binding protein [Azospirillum sp.]|uniref:peptidoglycan-binding domain-containing protein n=1 Tax=Azospirillum sp. TaxID=34012 RepID=UPI00260E1E6B|nr:peptidoglycan-binding protein [Azospirillum sp.]